jgi:hypothetical protein
MVQRVQLRHINSTTLLLGLLLIWLALLGSNWAAHAANCVTHSPSTQ